MFSKSVRITLLACTSLAAMLASKDAMAQPAASSTGLETVTVTAEKRAENMQDVPVSISAYTQVDLEQMRVDDITDIVRLTPGLSTTPTAGGYSPILSIRGISSSIGQSTTGIYIDDTPIQIRYFGAGATSAQAFPAIFDLDRVEVLRGPQGTLFGSGSEGGTVRFITPDASFTDYSGHARAEFGVNEAGAPSYQFGGAVGGPLLGDNLAFRVSAYVQQDGGYIDQKPYPDTYTSANNANSATTLAMTGALTWAVNDQLTITPKVFYQKVTTGAPNVYTRGDSNPSSDTFVNNAVVPQTSDDQFVLSSLKAEWALDGISVVSNTSYLNRSHTFTKDYTLSDNVAFTGNYTGPISPAPGYNQNPQSQFTEELRVQSTGESRLNWVIGGYYQQLHEGAVQPVVSANFNSWSQQVFGLTVPQLLGVPLLPGDLIYKGVDSYHDLEYAAFGQADFKLLDELTITAGVRYSTDRFTYSNSADGPFNGGPTGSAGSGLQNAVTPKLGIQYKPADDLMIYASASKGYRPGGANTPVPTSCNADLNKLGYSKEPGTYGEDSVWSYELGAKGESFSQRLVWDASAYYINWSKPQTQLILPTCGGYSFVGNEGSAVSKGVDIQVRFAVTDALTLGASAGYDDAQYTSTIAAVAGKNIVTSGQLLPTSPWQFSASVDYIVGSLTKDIQAYVHADDSFASGFTPTDPANALFDPTTPNSFQTENLTSVRVGVRTGAWDASIFASNLFDAHPIVSTSHEPPSTLFAISTVAPRVVGVTARYRF